MDKRQILKTFNNQFEELLNDVLIVFPNHTDMITCREGLLQARKMNPKILITIFKTDVLVPYKEQIIKNDIGFFINKDYKDDFVQQTQTNKLVLEKIDKLRDAVRNMGETNQMMVLKYMNNLLKLCNLYN